VRLVLASKRASAAVPGGWLYVAADISSGCHEIPSNDDGGGCPVLDARGARFSLLLAP